MRGILWSQRCSVVNEKRKYKCPVDSEYIGCVEKHMMEAEEGAGTTTARMRAMVAFKTECTQKGGGQSVLGSL